MAEAGDRNEAIQQLVAKGSEIVGPAAAGAMSALLPGPGGAVLGGAVAAPLTDLLRRIGDEAQGRVLGERERVRVGAAMLYAHAKFRENEASGKRLREDDFFGAKPGQRAAAEEIGEAVLLAAQREHEEKKLRFLGSLLGNVPFRPDIDRYQANHLIRLVSALSYRQVLVLAAFGARRTPDAVDFALRMDAERGERFDPNVATLRDELADLQQRWLLAGVQFRAEKVEKTVPEGKPPVYTLRESKQSTEPFNRGYRTIITEDRAELVGLGSLLFDLMGLHLVDRDDLGRVIALLGQGSGRPSTPVSASS